MSCGIVCRCDSDLALLWLWCRPAAVALIRPLVWELPYASSIALKRIIYEKKKNKNLWWVPNWKKAVDAGIRVEREK